MVYGNDRNFMDCAIDEEPRGQDRELLCGTACSGGIGRGRVMRLGVAESGLFVEGEVLVLETADPGYSYLFPVAKAIVFERGGMLSHAAVIARELGIPAVAGLSASASRLTSGSEVIVNGTAGTVEVLGD